jgi:hypothetical protein
MQSALIIGFYSLGLIGGIWLLCFRSKTFKDRKKPVGEKMLRSPGHSLFEKVEVLMDRMNLLVLLVGLLPILLIQIIGSPLTELVLSQTNQFLIILLPFVLGVCIAFFMSKKLLNLSHNLLGLKGERLVGEMLNKLMKDGFDVFHDFPLEPDGKSPNIDHIVVGPNGVFAIETKTWRKPKETSDGKNWEVTFDGKQLKFPHFTTNKGIGQATQNARLLSKHLSASTDEKVRAVPILALPGWFVSSKSIDPLIALNPKQIRSAILAKDKMIDESLQKKIAYQLELRCRDVEF